MDEDFKKLCAIIADVLGIDPASKVTTVGEALALIKGASEG